MSLSGEYFSLELLEPAAFVVCSPLFFVSAFQFVSCLFVRCSGWKQELRQKHTQYRHKTDERQKFKNANYSLIRCWLAKLCVQSFYSVFCFRAANTTEIRKFPREKTFRDFFSSFKFRSMLRRCLLVASFSSLPLWSWNDGWWKVFLLLFIMASLEAQHICTFSLRH